MSFTRISIGDRICQVLRSGGCFTLMYFDKNSHLTIDPEITWNRLLARLLLLVELRGGKKERWARGEHLWEMTLVDESRCEPKKKKKKSKGVRCNRSQWPLPRHLSSRSVSLNWRDFEKWVKEACQSSGHLSVRNACLVLINHVKN